MRVGLAHARLTEGEAAWSAANGRWQSGLSPGPISRRNQQIGDCAAAWNRPDIGSATAGRKEILIETSLRRLTERTQSTDPLPSKNTWICSRLIRSPFVMLISNPKHVASLLWCSFCDRMPNVSGENQGTIVTSEEAIATELELELRRVRNRAVHEFLPMGRASASLSGSFLEATR